MKGNYVGVMSSEHLQQRAEPSAQFNKWIHEDHLNLTVSLLCRFRFQTPTTIRFFNFLEGGPRAGGSMEVNGFSARWAG